MKAVITWDSSRLLGFLYRPRVAKLGLKVTAAWHRAIELSLGGEDTAKLRLIAQSRTEPASRVERARILLAYREDPSFFAVGRALGLHHQTVQRCVERAVVEGPMAALDDRPRPGREPSITLEAKVWLVSLACRDYGKPSKGQCKALAIGAGDRHVGKSGLCRQSRSDGIEITAQQGGAAGRCAALNGGRDLPLRDVLPVPPGRRALAADSAHGERHSLTFDQPVVEPMFLNFGPATRNAVTCYRQRDRRRNRVNCGAA
jgi:hypothetical protein